ncbi:unnamed protein product [marine sediment metagenome]|uniref:Uncharacterized protein n=1 Tax=marine sediment metagenome TaxID=412755 RepID=X1TGN3_9ZZZZ
MKCKIFYGKVEQAEDAFNKWAKGKALKKDVLIQTVAYSAGEEFLYDGIAIIVFHPEDPLLDYTLSELDYNPPSENRTKLDKALGRVPP